MKFLIDTQLPPALCGWLRERGHDAVHVFAIGMVAASDVEIAGGPRPMARCWSARTRTSSLRLPDRLAFPWLRCGNASNRALAAWLEPHRAQIETLLTAGERFVEAR